MEDMSKEERRAARHGPRHKGCEYGSRRRSLRQAAEIRACESLPDAPRRVVMAKRERVIALEPFGKSLLGTRFGAYWLTKSRF